MPEMIRTFGIATASSRQGQPGTPIEFDLSTPGRKRDGIRLDLTRMRTENFMSNPVALWMHGRDVRGGLPVGRWSTVEFRGAGDDMSLTGELMFDQDDPFAQDVERKFRAGFLNAVSIMWNTERNEDTGEMQFDLLEAGPVPIPADPEALIRAADMALGEYAEKVEELAASLRQVTHPDPADDEPGVLARVPMHVTRDAGNLSHDDLHMKLSTAIMDRYGTDEGGWPRATVFAVFDSDVIARDWDAANYIRHPYTVTAAGDVSLGDGVRVMLRFEDATMDDDEEERVAEGDMRAVVQAVMDHIARNKRLKRAVSGAVQV